MSDMTDLYGIQFVRRIIHGSFDNIMISVDPVLDTFILGYTSPHLIHEFLIQEIENVLNGTVVSETIISETAVSATISALNTGLYQDPHYDPDSTPDFVLPTADLLAIAQTWLQFVIANPRGRQLDKN